MTKLLAAFVVIVVSTVATGALLAQDFDSGMKAYNSGGFATALKIWTPLADQGYAPAQAFLGAIYHDGKGVEAGLGSLHWGEAAWFDIKSDCQLLKPRHGWEERFWKRNS
jgi:TPR repeat protein